MTALRYATLPGVVLSLLVMAISALSMPSDAAAQSQVAQAQRAITENYQLASGDILKINVFGHEDISGDYEVDGTGQITLSLIHI